MAEWGEVIDVVEIRQLDEKQELVNVYRYRAKTKKGIIFTETFHEKDVKVEKVIAVLKAKSELLDKTASI